MPLIVVHVGAFKTGTSFLQHTLAANRAALREEGVLYPGEGRGSHFSAVRDLARGSRAPGRGVSTWSGLVSQCVSWDGHVAILSAENLSLMRGDSLRELTRGFGDNPLRVVYGARDLVRTVPSQWQTFIRNSEGSAPSFTDYVAAIRGGDVGGAAAQSFWRTHDWPSVLEAWQRTVEHAELALLTVPPPGAHLSTLWTRFGQAAGFEAGGYPLATMRNSSLGAASAEVVRLISVAMASKPQPVPDRIARNRALRSFARRVLSRRSGDELRVEFPPEAGTWAGERTEEMLERVAAIGPRVYGSYDELRRVASSTTDRGTTRPESLPVEALLEAAHFGLEQWGDEARSWAIRESGADPWVRLDGVIHELVDVLDARAATR